MDTDERPDLHRGGESKLLLKAETEKIIGFAFEVLNEVGHGLNEKIYENSLTVLFKQNSIAFDQQRRFRCSFAVLKLANLFPT
jgi:GxxExxY protein